MKTLWFLFVGLPTLVLFPIILGVVWVIMLLAVLYTVGEDVYCTVTGKPRSW